MITEKKSITLDKEVIKRVEEQAKKEGRSFSNMVQRILEDYFKEMQNRTPFPPPIDME